MVEEAMELMREDALAGQVVEREVWLGEPADFGGFAARLWIAADEITEGEEFCAGEDAVRVTLACAVPDSGELTGSGLVAAFFADFPEGVFGGYEIDVGPSTGECPAAVVGGFPDHEDASVRVDHGATHIDLRCGVAGFTVEERGTIG